MQYRQLGRTRSGMRPKQRYRPQFSDTDYLLSEVKVMVVKRYPNTLGRARSMLRPKQCY